MRRFLLSTIAAPNQRMQRTVQNVTHFAVAKYAPFCPAADAWRWATTMAKKALSFFPVTLCVAAIVFTGCSKEEPKMPSGSTSDYRKIALEFAKSLAAREYPTAYAMTSQGYRQNNSVDQLRIGFETIVPIDWGATDPIEVGQTMTNWPGKQPSDLGRAYVSIGGDVYSEAVTVVVTSENGEAKIREVEFGRP